MRVFNSFAIGLVLLTPASVAAANFANLPLSFEPNRGQADPGVLFLARGSGCLLTLRADESRILMHHGPQSAEIATRLIGANEAPRLDPLDRLPGHSSYFRGQDPAKWVTAVPNFAKVRAAGVYPGIDLIYYANQSRLAYDFVVAPGANPHAIRMRFDGVSSLGTDASGNLVLGTPAGEIVQQKPVIYQTIGGTHPPVQGRFLIGRNRCVSFHLASSDR